MRLAIICALLFCGASAFAANVPFTVNMLENVTVNTAGGTPRIQLDVGGVTRYASYASGTGTSALTFNYAVQARDFDADGISASSPIQLNGGVITDAAGNALSALTFTPPTMTNVKVQTYTVAWTTDPITPANETAAAISIAKAPNGATYNYTITSSGGAGNVTGSGTISADPQAVTSIDVSALPAGTLTASVTITAPSGTGSAKTATASASFAGALDSLASTSVAYSTRRLRSGYTGPLLRVRRSSDNAEQDISYTLAGNLNTAALATFCGANSCFITTWYDQSGNGRNAVQAGTTEQPRVVNGGVNDTQGGRVSPLYDGSNDRLIISSSFTTRSVSTVIRYGVASFPDYNGLLGGPLGDPGNGHIVNAIVSTTQIVRAVDTAFYTSWRNGVSTVSANFSPINASISATFIGSSDINNSQVWIGNISGGGRFWQGNIAEMIIFPTPISIGDRQSIEASQRAYFGIP